MEQGKEALCALSGFQGIYFAFGDRKKFMEHCAKSSERKRFCESKREVSGVADLQPTKWRRKILQIVWQII